MLAGVESELSYYYMDIGGEEPSESSLTLRWANSVLGDTTAEKEQQEGGTQINIEIVGPTQSPHSEVTFVIRERFAPTGDDREALAHTDDTEDQEALVCAVDISASGVKAITLCTTISFTNDTTDDLDIDLGNLSATGVFTSIGSELVEAGDTEYMRIEVCTAKYARLRPTNGNGSDESQFQWCDEYLPLDAQDAQHTVTCKSEAEIFHCTITPSIRDPLDARQRWRVAPVRTLVNMLPCPIRAELFPSDSASSSLAAGSFDILPGAKQPFPTRWPYPSVTNAWLSISKLGTIPVPAENARVCVYACPSKLPGGQDATTPEVASSFSIELLVDGSVEHRGRASIGYEDGSDVVLYCSHWIVNKTSQTFIARGTGEHNTGSFKVVPRTPQVSEVDDFASVLHMFGVGSEGTLLFKCCGTGGEEIRDAEEQSCEVDVAQKVASYDMKADDKLTRCSLRVGLAESEFWRTKIIEINPLWVLVNQTSSPLTVAEHAERPQVIQLSKSSRALRANDNDCAPSNLDIGQSNEVFAAARGPKLPYSMRFALGIDVPVVEESITIKVWEHERRIISKEWSPQNLGDYSMSPLISVPIAGGDPPHLVLVNPGGQGQPIIETDEIVRQVAVHLDQAIRSAGDDWEWIDTWTVSKDVEHGSTDAKGWEYCDAAALGMKDRDAADMCRQEEWQGEGTSSSFFRRRCWTRTQRRYLTAEAKEAALIGSMLTTANLGTLEKYCRQLKIWDSIPAVSRGKPGLLRERLRRRVARATTSVWSTPSTLPLSGDTQLNIPTFRSRQGRRKGGHALQTVCVNVNVTSTAQGTLLAVLTDAKQPHYSLDNRSGIPLQSRIVTTRSRDTWFDVPISKGGACTDVWEGESGAMLQLKVHGSEDEGPVARMNDLGELPPWEVAYMTPHGPTTIVLVPSVAIQREAKTLIIRRQAAKARGGISEIVGQFALDIALAGCGISLVNREPKELLYMSMNEIHLTQTPVTTLTVQVSRLNNVIPSTANTRTPKLILQVGSQEYVTRSVQNAGGFVTYKGETASFKTGALQVLEITCIDPANKDEVLGRGRINLHELKLEEKPFVEQWFDLPHEANVAASDSAADIHALLEDLDVYLRLEVSSTLDRPEVIEFGLGSFQLDNQDQHCEDPVVLSPEDMSSHRDLVSLHIIRCTSLDGLTSQLDDVELNVAPMKLLFNYQFVAPLMELVGDLPWGSGAAFDGEAELRRQIELRTRFDELAAQSTANPTKMYAKRVALSDMKITATVKLKQLLKETNSSRAGPLFKLISTIGVNLSEIDKAPIELDSLQLPLKSQDPFTTQGALLGAVMDHVYHQAVLIGLRVLGHTNAADFLLSPVKVGMGVLSGLEELGTGLIGLRDGDVVGAALGGVGLVKNVAGSVLSVGTSSLGLIGGVLSLNKYSRNTVGALIGEAQKGMAAIDGQTLTSRNRAIRQFGFDDEIIAYRTSITLGNHALRSLQHRGRIPAWVAEQQCLSSVFLMNVEHDRAFVTLVTEAHVLQLSGPTHGFRSPTNDVLETLRLVKAGATRIAHIRKACLDSGAIRLTRSQACHYVRNEMTDTVEERTANDAGSARKTEIKIVAADASLLDDCFSALTRHLRSTRQQSEYTELRAPVLTVSVLSADNLPKGRHVPLVAFVVQVPGARKERYVSAGHDDDVNPTFDESAHFVIKDYHSLTQSNGVTLEVWDRNTITSDSMVGKTSLACGDSDLNPLPTAEQVSMGDTWETDGTVEFELRNESLKRVGTVRLVMGLAPRVWSWEHRLSLNVAGNAVLSKIWMKEDLLSSPGTPTVSSLHLSPRDPLVSPPAKAVSPSDGTEAEDSPPQPETPASPSAVASPARSPTNTSPRKFDGCKIHVRVLSASNIPCFETGALQPYVQLKFRDEGLQRTETERSGSRNPSWNESERDQHQFRVPAAASKSRVFGSLWNRARAIPPDDLLATFELPISHIQLEVTVLDIRLTPAMDTMPLPPGEIPTVRIMCVRTEQSMQAPLDGLSPPAMALGAQSQGSEEEVSSYDDAMSTTQDASSLGVASPLSIGNSPAKSSHPSSRRSSRSSIADEGRYHRVSVRALPAEVDAKGKVRYRFQLTLGDDDDSQEILQSLSTRYVLHQRSFCKSVVLLLHVCLYCITLHLRVLATFKM